jgi:hypothetical protein
MSSALAMPNPSSYTRICSDFFNKCAKYCSFICFDTSFSIVYTSFQTGLLNCMMLNIQATSRSALGVRAPEAKFQGRSPL